MYEEAHATCHKVHLAAEREGLGRDAELLLPPIPDGYSRWPNDGHRSHRLTLSTRSACRSRPARKEVTGGTGREVKKGE